MEDKFKFKPLTKQQIIISMDRLTRFKPTEEKYLRVFKDIIISNLIYPKFRKHQLELMDYEILKNYAQNIFNFSLKSFNFDISQDFVINSKLFEYENKIFKLNKEAQSLLKNEISYATALKLIEDDNPPLNLKWLKNLSKNDNQIKNRENFSLKFPLEKIIITEGITEEILLPKFAKLCGYDFDKEGIFLISAGGKNQVVKAFYQLSDILKVPIFVLLDKDAEDNFKEITPKLRKTDKVHVLASGEFEDILPLNLIKRTLNNHFKNFSSVALNDLRQNISMTKSLEDIFKEKGFKEFKKAEFAALIGENITSKNDVSEEIKNVVEEIKKL